MDRVVKTAVHEIDGRHIDVAFYEVSFPRARYHAVLRLSDGDAVVLDARNLEQLELLVRATLPAIHWSRRLPDRAA